MQEVTPIHPMPIKNFRDVGPRYKPLLFFFVITLSTMVVENEVDDVAEGRMADIVKQRCNLLFDRCPDPANQEHCPYRVIEAGKRWCNA